MPTLKFRQDLMRTVPYVGAGRAQCIYWDQGLTTLAQPQDEYIFGLRTKTASYYSTGLPYQSLDGLNRPVTYSDYAAGIARRVDYADGSYITRTVNNFGEVMSVTDERGHTITYGRDSMGRITSVTFPAGDVVAWTNQSLGYVALTASELDQPVGSWRQRITQGRFQKSTYFDAMLRPVLVEEKDTATGTGIYVRTRYDYAGRVTFRSYPSSNYAASAGINYSYDALGRLTQRQTTDGIVLETRVYLAGNRQQVTDADGRVTTTTYQAFDAPDYRLATRIESPENQTTVIARDAFGQATSITQSGNWSGGFASATRSFEYDAYRRPCRRTDPERGSTLWGYDAASQTVWEAKGQSGSGCAGAAPSGATVFQYDGRGRKVLSDNPGTADDVSYGYDLAGNLTSVSNPIAVWSYTYNKRSLLETEQVVIDGLTRTFDRTYNGLGQLMSLTTPLSALSYAPDAWGRPTQIGSYVSAIQYHPNALPSSYTLGNGVTYSQTLDGRLRPYVQDTRNGSTSIQRFVYGYSPASQLLSIDDQVDDVNDLSASYDGLHRLSSASGLWGSYSYGYDTLNNLRSRTGANALSYSYDAATNRLSTVGGSQTRSYSYNPRGEVSGEGGKTFSLNANGQITDIAGVASYDYDGRGKRIKIAKCSLRYTLYTSDGRLAYAESGSQAIDYLSLAGQPVVELKRVNGVTTPTYLHPDLLGSPRAATDAAGTELWREHYDPFGEKLNNVAQKIGYTGHAYDSETRYTYMQARFYDAQVGRFLSTDPVDDDFNLYAYVGNDPLNKTDPTGKFLFVIPVIGYGLTALESAVFVSTAVVAGVGAAAVINEAKSDNDDAPPADTPAEPAPGTAESDKGCIYRCDGVSEGQRTPSGKPYVGSADDKERRAATARDGRERDNGETIGEYKKGDRTGRQNAEQKGMNESGGKDNLDNKRNEVSEDKWKQRDIEPPRTL